MRLHCGQKCSSTGAPAPQVRHSSVAAERTGMKSGVIMRQADLEVGLYVASRRLRPKGRAAAAGLLRVRVVEDESLGDERRVVVENRAPEEQIALLVDEDPGALWPLEHLVAEAGLALPRERVAEARAAPALDAHTQPSLADALLGHQRFDLPGCGFGYLNHVQFPTSNCHIPIVLGVGSRELGAHAIGCAGSCAVDTPFDSSCFFL